MNANIAVMLGRTSGNLVCVDCDSEQAFDKILDEFSSRGLNFWAFTTSRGGNLLFRLAEGEVKNLTKTSIQDVQVWGNKHYCILPPSVHPSGIVYSWLNDQDPREDLARHEPPPLLHLDQLAWLGVQRNGRWGKPIELYGLPAWTKHLSDHSRRILSNRILEGQRNSELTIAVYDVAAAITAGLVGYEAAQALLRKAASNCIPPYPIKQVDSMLTTALRKRDLTRAKEYFQTKNSYSDSIDLALSFLQYHDWKSHGRFAQTDQAVFRACIVRAQMDRCVPFRASTREVAELANIQRHQTTMHALRRLSEKNILQLKNSDSRGAAMYSFGDEIHFLQRTTISTCKNSGALEEKRFQPLLPKTYTEKDVFLKLGKASWPIWTFLRDQPGSTVKAIINGCNLYPSTTKRTIQRLEKWGLVTYSPAEGVYFAETLDEATLANIAEQLGSNGNSICRKNRYTREREIHTNQLIASARNRFDAMVDGRTLPNGNPPEGGY